MRPTLSLIVPAGVAGREEMIEALRRSVAVNVRCAYEMVVEHGSPSCGQGWTSGAERAEGEVLWFVADDVELRPSPGLLRSVERALAGEVVCPILFNPDGTLQGAGAHGKNQPDGSTAGNCAFPMMSRQTWEEIGEIPPTNHFCDTYITEWASRRRRGPVVTHGLQLTHKVMRPVAPGALDEYREWRRTRAASLTSAGTGAGLVAVVAQETARYSMFASSLSELDLPDGSKRLFRFGWDLADLRNALIEEMLAAELDWIWFIDDDHAFSPDTVSKLLARDADVVVPLCLMRNAPYRPVVWTTDGDEPTRLELRDHPDGGVVPIAYAGAAGMLIRRRVFDRVEYPWFEAGTGITGRVGEDTNLCRKIRAAGYDIYVDLDTVIGHCATTVVWPVRESDGWTFAFSMMGGFHVTLPPAFQAYADEVSR